MRTIRLSMTGSSRRAALALSLAVAAACTPAPAEIAPAPTGRSAPALTLTPKHAEVWAWQTELSGEAPAPLATCRVRVTPAEDSHDEHTYPASVSGARFRVRVRLAPGTNHAVATCKPRSGGPLRSPVATLQAMLRDVPTARITASARQGVLWLDASASTPSPGSGAPIASHAWAMSRVAPNGATIAKTTPLGAGPRIAFTPPAPGAAQASGAAEGTRRFVVSVDVRDAEGAHDGAEILVDVEGGRARVVDRLARERPWPRDAIVYGVYPPLYGEPPLDAVRRALPDIARLGVTTLWLSPVFESPPGDYGYAVTNYFHVRRSYGTERDLVALVEDAHARGLEVILDFVPNHTSAEHRYFRESQALGRASHYFPFYVRTKEGAATHYFDWAHLPNLSYADPEVGRWMLAATSKWLRVADVDGYRVDAAWGVERRAPSFWDAWVRDVVRQRPGALLIAEASARDPFWTAHGFDAAYDWTDELGHWAWRDVFDAPPAEIPDRLDRALHAGDASKAPGSHVLRFLDNNDTGPRFVTKHGEGMTRVATAALFTLPGIPELFAGSERGAEYEPYATEGPVPGVRSGDPHGLLAWHRKLIAARRSSAALRGDGFARLRATPGRGVYAYFRRDEAARDSAVVVLHFGDAPASVRVVLPPEVPPNARLEEALGDGSARAKGGEISLDLGPWDARVLLVTAGASDASSRTSSVSGPRSRGGSR